MAADGPAGHDVREPALPSDQYITAEQLRELVAEFPEPADGATPAHSPQHDSIRLRTAPTDARFPNINQTRNCWQNYVDYLKCVRLTSPSRSFDDQEGAAVWCRDFKRALEILCPSSWVERWEAARKEGLSPHVDTIERSLRQQQQQEGRH